MEIWKDVQGYDGKYQISNMGKVKSLPRIALCRNGIIKSVPGGIMVAKVSNGYLIIGLRDGKKKRFFTVHSLVAKAFIANPQDNRQVNHKNGNKADNRAENLEWVTASENVRHSFRVLNRPKNYGRKNGSCRLTEDNVRFIRAHYIPGHPIFGQSAMARQFSVTQYAVRSVITGHCWAWLE